LNDDAMSPPLDLRFVMSADEISRLPESDAEVTFAGRSNVGKSSLINALANRKRLAHVSKTPGRTQLLNCFAVDGHQARTVVDLPGYGYAAVPGRVRATWQPMIEGYLTEREALVMILVLVDGEIGPTKLDIQMLDWLRANDLPFTVVATKHDKVKSSRRDRRKRELTDGCLVAPGDVVWVSATTGVGIDRLRDLIREWLGA
jgi:GTP-binding protein